MASYSFCSSVMPSMGLGCSSSTTPVTGFILEIEEGWGGVVCHIICHIYSLIPYINDSSSVSAHQRR